MATTERRLVANRYGPLCFLPSSFHQHHHHRQPMEECRGGPSSGVALSLPSSLASPQIIIHIAATRRTLFPAPTLSHSLYYLFPSFPLPPWHTHAHPYASQSDKFLVPAGINHHLPGSPISNEGVRRLNHSFYTDRARRRRQTRGAAALK